MGDEVLVLGLGFHLSSPNLFGPVIKFRVNQALASLKAALFVRSKELLGIGNRG